MMSQHFALSSELTGAIAKILPHAKNQLSAPCIFFNQFVTYIYIYKRFACLRTVRLADTLCPPEAAFWRLWSPLINYIGDNISK